MKSPSWLGTRANRLRWEKAAAGTASQAFRCAGTRHAGKGETTSSRADPARRTGDPAYAAQRAASVLPNVQQATIKPIITQAVAPGTLIQLYRAVQNQATGRRKSRPLRRP